MCEPSSLEENSHHLSAQWIPSLQPPTSNFQPPTSYPFSVGECFDKISRLAGITSIPGGPHLERLADEGEAILAEIASAPAAAEGGSGVPGASSGAKAAAKLIAKYEVTMPMQNGAHRDSCNFSFSGLKTSVAKVWGRLQRCERSARLNSLDYLEASLWPSSDLMLVHSLRSHS